jgi:hypothetical protein
MLQIHSKAVPGLPFEPGSPAPLSPSACWPAASG